MRHLISIDDLSDNDLDALLARAAELAAAPSWPRRDDLVAATVFLTSSLRTRAGFTAAVHRLGGHVIDVSELRSDSTMSTGESFDDTIRTLSGMADVLVTRTPFPLSGVDLSSAVCPLVNGGDGGVEHPTQALIDVSAITALVGPLGGLRLAISGDPTMRAVSSLLRLLARRPPQHLSIVCPPTRGIEIDSLPEPLRSVTTLTHDPAVGDVDVLYLPGLPLRKGDDVLPDDVRARYAFGTDMADTLPPSAVVLSPLPVIDEVASAQRSDRRLRIWEQSDRSVAVRAAVIEWALSVATQQSGQ